MLHIQMGMRQISIHAPHARSDNTHSLIGYGLICNFNPRSSCEERQDDIYEPERQNADFNPRSSCEERRRPDSMRL